MGARASRVRGRIAIVQEDRIRVIDEDGRGYLFVVRKGGAEPETLELWRERGTLVDIEYEGEPDRGAVANSLRSAAPDT